MQIPEQDVAKVKYTEIKRKSIWIQFTQRKKNAQLHLAKPFVNTSKILKSVLDSFLFRFFNNQMEQQRKKIEIWKALIEKIKIKEKVIYGRADGLD